MAFALTVTAVELPAAGHMKPPVVLSMFMLVPVVLKLYDVPSTKQLLGKTEACTPAMQAMEVAVVLLARHVLGFVTMVTLALLVYTGLKLNCLLEHAPTPVMLLTVSCTEVKALAPPKLAKLDEMPVGVHSTVMILLAAETAAVQQDDSVQPKSQSQTGGKIRTSD